MTRIQREMLKDLKIDIANVVADLYELRDVSAFDQEIALIADKLRAKIDAAVAKCESGGEGPK